MTLLSKTAKILCFMNYRVKVTLLDTRVLIGTFLAFDKLMNLVLGECDEFRTVHVKGVKKGEEKTKVEKRTLGLVLLRGENIIGVEIEGPAPPPSMTKPATKGNAPVKPPAPGNIPIPPGHHAAAGARPPATSTAPPVMRPPGAMMPGMMMPPGMMRPPMMPGMMPPGMMRPPGMVMPPGMQAPPGMQPPPGMQRPPGM